MEHIDVVQWNGEKITVRIPIPSPTSALIASVSKVVINTCLELDWKLVSW